MKDNKYKINEITNKVICGEALSVLKKFPDKCIDTVMTSPPYWGLRDYGTAKWEGGDKDCDHIVSRKTRTQTNKSYKQLTNKGSYDDESIKNSKECSKCGAIRIDKQIGIEPDFNVYINKLCDIFDEVYRTLKDEGSLWVNIGDTYYGGGKDGKYCTEEKSKIQLGNKGSLGVKGSDFKKMKYKDKCLCMIPQRFAIEMIRRGWILRNTIIWYKKNCMPSSVKDRFTVDFEYLYFFVKQNKYYFEQQFEKTQRPGEIGKFSQKWRPKKEDPNFRNGHEQYGTDRLIHTNKLRNKRTVWTINPQPFSEAHFATFPPTLVENVINAGCPEFVCTKCGKTREKIFEHNEIYEDGQAEVVTDPQPYSVQKRNGMVAIRKLPEHNEIREYLNHWKNKSNITIDEIENIFNTQAPHHWFEQNGSFPSKKDWIELKKILKFDDKYDDVMIKEFYKRAEKQNCNFKNIGYTKCNCNADFEKGIILDPFLGSGTTAMVAKNMRRNFVGIELNKEYVEMSLRRITYIPKRLPRKIDD